MKTNLLGGHNCRNRMFVDKLRLPVSAQEYAKIIKPGDYSLQFHSINQKHCNGILCFSDVVEKCVL